MPVSKFYLVWSTIARRLCILSSKIKFVCIWNAWNSYLVWKMKMREPTSSPYITAYCHVPWNTSLVFLCASGFSSVKWAQELNWRLHPFQEHWGQIPWSLWKTKCHLMYFLILTCLVSMCYVLYTVARCDILNIFMRTKVVCMP